MYSDFVLFRQEKQCAPILTIDTTFNCQQANENMDPLPGLGPSGGPDDIAWGLSRRRHQAVIISGAVAALKVVVLEEEQQRQEEEGVKKKRRKRTSRRLFDSQAAFNCITRDYLGANALYGKDFICFFRLSRTRVQKLMEDFGALATRTTNSFYKSFRQNSFGHQGASLEVKVLLPLKAIAFGVAPHAFSDYFQVSIPMARECHRQFLATIKLLYADEYLRLPDKQDLRNVLSLHQSVHGVPGMVGSLDCMQTTWKNCPVAWQQSFRGRTQGKSTIVLEAACDYNLWFWHAAYGFSGSLNDGNVLSLSPLLDRMTSGKFSKLEEEAGVVPFFIEGTATGFNNTYFLVDGIYPAYTRFVKAILHPSEEDERRYTKWQESARKDIERAFGVMQCRFKSIASPIHIMNEESIYNLAASCLIMHNMCVQERIMGNCNERYDPSIEGELEDVPATHGRSSPDSLPPRLMADFSVELTSEVLRRREWLNLVDPLEWSRLQTALIQFKGKHSTDESIR